ncbi:unnamed protein product [Rotaria sp. Silwood1]|nr:unnamed protein product [Rotaria sp. Silwood1]CAF1631784.1 unnamed protein product [Rotaria sp. Silwood1]CAF3742633.1 unnamed protein product [Rotaria sp. Silwood1]CAF3806168.1 unnamed protein product [Rotaria sp. Silwood1]CAF3816461.1 unnamed protein product [Rotaria sp. Silwood1]
MCAHEYKPVLKNAIQWNSRTQSLAIGDFDRDQRLDIVTANYGANNLGILLGYNNGTFSSPKTFSTGMLSRPSSVVVNDFNNDARLDIAVTNFGTNSIGIFLGYGNATFSNQNIITTNTSRPLSIAIGDFNSDTHMDIAVVNYGTNSIGVLIGFGNCSFAHPTIYPTGYDSDPRSIVVAYLNNDSQLDIVVANHGTNNIGIFLGNSDGTFASQIVYSTGLASQPYSIAIGDLNNDNLLDIVVANSGRDNVGIFFGHGNGMFREQITFSTGTGSRPHSVTVADLNKDSIVDIAVANSQTHMVSIFLGYDNESFHTQVTYPTGYNSEPQFLMLGDFNNDQLLDIVVANNGTNDVGILLGWGNGSFADPILYSTGTGSRPYSIAIGDFNNDNRMDIAAANSETGTVGIFLGYDNGSFADQITYSTGDRSYPYSIVISDFNNDNNMDIAVANYGESQTVIINIPYGKSFTVAVLLNIGNGTFAPAVMYSTGYYSLPNSIAAGDFNNDKKMDIAVVNSGTNNVGVFLGYGDGSFMQQITYSTDDYPTPFFVAIGDFDNDRRTDIVVSNSYDSTILLLFSYDIVLYKAITKFQTAKYRHPYSLLIADLNRDENLDIALSNPESNEISLLFGYGNMSFTAEESFTSDDNSYPRFIISADINRDNTVDIIVANVGTNNIGVFLGYENGSFQDQITYSTGSNSQPFSVVVGDFNNDTRLDIAFVNYASHNLGLLFGYDIGNFEARVVFSNSEKHSFYDIAIGDFNNDNQMDVVVINYDTSSINILLRFDNGALINRGSYEVLGYPSSVAVGDFNHDQNMDIVVTIQGSSIMRGIERVEIYLGYGNGTFTNSIFYFTGIYSNPCSVNIADFNNDNRLDIAITNNHTGNVGIFLGHGNGSFMDQVTYSTGKDSYPLSMVISDFNNDNQIDIAVANSGTNTIGVFLGYGNGSFMDQMTYLTGNGSSPKSLAIGDFNNDNRMDIVVANSRTNMVSIFLGYGNGLFADQMMYSTGTDSYPHYVAVGDLNNDKRMDIIVANRNMINIGLFLGSGDGFFSSQQTFSTNSIYSPLSIKCVDWNEDNRLDLIVIDATNIFILFGSAHDGFIDGTTYTTGNGSFPRFLSVADFNNDDQLDIVVANSGSDSVGVFLGNGNGNFADQITYSTGFRSQPYAVVVGDLNSDTRVDLVVVNYGTHSISIFRGCGNGSFLQNAIYSTGALSYPSSVGLCDFNKDTQLDIAISNSASNELFILFGVENGTFVNETKISMGYGAMPIWLSFADIDNDNWTDIAVVNYGFQNIEILSPMC